MKKLVAFITFVTACTYVTAQEIAVSERSAPTQVTFAQPFNVAYHLSHTPGYEVTLDQESLSSDFEVTQAVFTPTSPGTGSYDFTLMPFALGKSTFTVTFLLTKDGKTAAQIADTLPVDIAAAKTFNDKKLREIRPPHVPAGWWMWLMWLLLLAGVGYALYLWRKRRALAAHTLLTRQDKRPCDQIALSKIDALVDSGLWERRAYKLFYITLTDILREYIWKQFRADVSADTSVELLRRAKNIPAMVPWLVSLRDFLNSGDLVKFAKVEPQETTRNKDVEQLRQIIRGTVPPPPETNGEKHV